jgi:DNA-binding response OmpR family regulator
MISLKLEDAKVLVVDSQLHTRRLLKDALHMIGFRKMNDIRKVEELAGAVVSYEPDLIMIDIDEQRDFVCQSIKAIRNRKLGCNPFVAIVALTWQPEKQAIGEVLAAGTDDMVMKPVSPKILRDRVVNLIEHRKDFVVTSDYVGPDRRSGDRAPSENDLPTVAVPNSLRHATTKDESAAVNVDAVADTIRSLCAQKIFRLANHMGTIAADLHGQCLEKPDLPLPDSAMSNIGRMLLEIEEIISEHEFDSIMQISQSTRTILDGIVAAGGCPPARQVELLHLHGQAIAVTLKDSDQAGDALADALSEAALVVNG